MSELLQSPNRKGRRVTLPNHQACIPCRELKKKCDARLPKCGRCERQNIECRSQVAVPRRKPTDNLQERLALLETQFAFAQTRDLISQSLWDKLRLLNSWPSAQSPQQALSQQLALWPYETIPITAASVYPWGKIVDEELETGYAPAITREEMGQRLMVCAPRFDGGHLPKPFSMWLIRLFLPFRFHFHFVVETKILFAALALPPDHPESLHPALLNAIYLSTCWIVGGDLARYKGYFLAQTRFYMNQALWDADRLMHFLWANLILATFFALEGRTKEADVTINSCVQFALACGLDVVHYRSSTPPARRPILPPPQSEAQFIERAQLSVAMYILDRTIAMIAGVPSAFLGALDPASVSTETLQQEMDGLFQETQIPPLVIPVIIYERIEQLARRAEFLSPDELDVQLAIYSWALDNHRLTLPVQLDAWGLDEYETMGKANPVNIFAHINHHGCVMLLYTLKAKTDMKARTRVIEAATKLAELGALIRGETGLKRVHASLLLMFHMSNAARVFASYLGTSEVATSNECFAQCCKSIGMLVELLHDSSAMFTSWARALQSLQELFPKAPSDDHTPHPTEHPATSAPDLGGVSGSSN